MLKEKKPTALVLSRNEVNSLDGTDALLVTKGAYIVRKETKKKHGIIISTGSELEIALKVADTLYEKGIDIIIKTDYFFVNPFYINKKPRVTKHKSSSVPRFYNW